MLATRSRTITSSRCLVGRDLCHRQPPASPLNRHDHRHHFSTSVRSAASRRTPDFNSGFTGTYDPNLDNGRGPMFNKSSTSVGVPQFYPRDLKKRVDDYVVGQDRAKKTICSTIFNHYQSVRRRYQHELDERNRREKEMRQRLSRDRETHQRRREAAAASMHPVEGQQQHQKSLKPSISDAAIWPEGIEPLTTTAAAMGARGPLRRRNRADNNLEDEFPAHFESVRSLHDADALEEDPLEHTALIEDPAVPEPVKIDKSNLLLIGPTGVGKTYILE